jgi:hypothetical protein
MILGDPGAPRMSTLLVLGSKPDPRLPPPGSIDHVACANGSGFSASRHGLPMPIYTVVTSILGTGIPSAVQSLGAMRGLRTEMLVISMRPPPEGPWLKRMRRRLQGWRAHPVNVRRQLRAAGYTWDRCLARPDAAWRRLVRELCQDDPEVVAALARKSPSTGLFAIAEGLSDPRFDRVVVSGFSFELTHAYGANPEIAERGTRASRHAPTDITVMRSLARCRSDLVTSEPVVAEAVGLPLIASDDDRGASDPKRQG